MQAGKKPSGNFHLDLSDPSALHYSGTGRGKGGGHGEIICGKFAGTLSGGLRSVRGGGMDDHGGRI